MHFFIYKCWAFILISILILIIYKLLNKFDNRTFKISDSRKAPECCRIPLRILEFLDMPIFVSLSVTNKTKQNHKT